MFAGPFAVFLLFLLLGSWTYYNFSTHDKGYGSLILFLIGMVYVPLFSALLLLVLSLWIGWKCHETDIPCEKMLKRTAAFGAVAGLLAFAVLFYTISLASSGTYARTFAGEEVLANIVVTALLFAATGTVVAGVGSVVGRIANSLM